MGSILSDFEKEQMNKISYKVPNFRAGDLLNVVVKIKEKETIRKQFFEGVCISLKGSGLGRSFTVRKIKSVPCIEKTFPLYCGLIDRIDVIKKGKVRSAKIHYIRRMSSKQIKKKLF